MFKRLGLSPRTGTIALLSGIAALMSIGCGEKAPVVQTYDPAVSTAASTNLLGLYEKLNNVYDQDMTASDAKIDPEEKAILAKLQDPKADVKAMIAKDHKLFVDGIETTKKAQMHLSTATSTKVDPMEHDKYVAYFVAIGELLTAKRTEYEALLAYEAKPTEENKAAVLLAARTVQGKKLVYTEKKR